MTFFVTFPLMQVIEIFGEAALAGAALFMAEELLPDEPAAALLD